MIFPLRQFHPHLHHHVLRQIQHFSFNPRYQIQPHCQYLIADVLPKLGYCFLHGWVFFQVDLDAVGNVEVAGFADVLDAVDQFAGHALGHQSGRKCNVERHGKWAVVGDQPAGDVFGGDFEIFQVQVEAGAADLQGIFFASFRWR